MKKTVKTLIVSVVLTVFMCSAALAGTWMEDEHGYWWQNDRGEYPVSSWQWIDDDENGIAECYYFDENGYLLMDTMTPDGYTVDSGGAWVDGWEVQYKALTPDADAYLKESEGRRLYMGASYRNTQLQDLDSKSVVSISVSMDGMSIGTVSTMASKYKDLNTESMKYLVTNDMQMFGQSIKETGFYENGFYYLDSLGQKLKAAVDVESMTLEIQNASAAPLVDTNYITDFKITEEQGNRVITYRVDASAFASEINQSMAMMGSDSAEDEVTIHYRDMSGRAVVTPDGYCQSDYITMVMDLASTTEEAVKITLAITMDVSYVNPGQPVDFALPSKAEYTLVE